MLLRLLLFLPLLFLLHNAIGSPPLAGDWCPWRPYDCQLSPPASKADNSSLECKQVLVRRCCIDPSIHCAFRPRIRLAPARNECLTEACVVRAHWCPWSPWQGSNNTCGDIVRRRKRERCCHPGSGQHLAPEACFRGPGDDVEMDSTLETVVCGDQQDDADGEDGAEESAEGPEVVLVPGPTPGPLLIAAAAAIPVAFVLAMGAAVGFVVCCRRERQQRRHECMARAYFCRADDRTPLCGGDHPCEPPPSYEDSVLLTFPSRD